MKKLIAYVMTVLVLAAPAHANEKEDSSRVPVSRGKYITGGILASTVGFGIGHAVQGRYSDRGWIFTAAEVAGFVIATSALSRCASRASSSLFIYDGCSSESGTMALGLATMLGFHVWEIIDSWTGARPVDEKKVSLIVVPDPKAPAAFVAWRF